LEKKQNKEKQMAPPPEITSNGGTQRGKRLWKVGKSAKILEVYLNLICGL